MMLSFLPAFAVCAGAIGLVWVQRKIEANQGRWIRAAVARLDPAGQERLSAVDDPDPATLEWIPEELRPLCPTPPFVAAVYHHSCGSCRELWKEIAVMPELSEVHMVHSAARAEFLRGRGILRGPAIALPDEIMESLPSGMAIRVDADWRIIEMRLATTVGDLRPLIGETAGTRGEAAGTRGEAAGTRGEAAGTRGEAAGTLGQAAGTLGQAAGNR